MAPVWLRVLQPPGSSAHPLHGGVHPERRRRARHRPRRDGRRARTTSRVGAHDRCARRRHPGGRCPRVATRHLGAACSGRHRGLADAWGVPRRRGSASTSSPSEATRQRVVRTGQRGHHQRRADRRARRPASADTDELARPAAHDGGRARAPLSAAGTSAISCSAELGCRSRLCALVQPGRAVGGAGTRPTCHVKRGWVRRGSSLRLSAEATRSARGGAADAQDRDHRARHRRARPPSARNR